MMASCCWYGCRRPCLFGPRFMFLAFSNVQTASVCAAPKISGLRRRPKTSLTLPSFSSNEVDDLRYHILYRYDGHVVYSFSWLCRSVALSLALQGPCFNDRRSFVFTHTITCHQLFHISTTNELISSAQCPVVERDNYQPIAANVTPMPLDILIRTFHPCIQLSIGPSWPYFEITFDQFRPPQYDFRRWCGNDEAVGWHDGKKTVFFYSTLFFWSLTDTADRKYLD